MVTHLFCVLPFPECRISGIMHYVAFVSVSVTTLKSTYVVACLSSSFLFIAEDIPASGYIAVCSSVLLLMDIRLLTAFSYYK